jgi:hypothetical protein
LHIRRAENIVKVLYDARERLAAWGVEETKPATLSIALPILQGAADEDRDELVDLWARLLANAMDPKLNSVRHSFIDAVKRMDPLDAVVLRYIHENKIAIVWGEPRKGLGCDNIGRAIDRRYDEVELSILHLIDLGFFKEVRYAEEDQEYTWLQWRVTIAYREFMRACYPEVTPE